MQCFEISNEQKINKLPESKMMEQLTHLEEVQEEVVPYFIILSKEEFEKIQGYFSINEVMIHKWFEIEEVAKLEAYAKYDLGIATRIVWQHEQFMFEVIRFMIGKKCLIIVVEQNDSWLQQLVVDLQADQNMTYTLGYIFYRVIDCIIAKDRKYLEHLAKRTSELEEDILNEVEHHFVEKNIKIRKQVTFFKSHYDPLADIVEDLMSNNQAMCNEEDIRYFKILNNRINRLSHFIEEIDDYTTHVREAYDAQIDIQQNRIMKYFTLITSIFLPLTLIVGWYGMNFTTMPEISWKYGYYYVIVLTVVSSIFCLYYFKKKRWF